MKSCTVTWCGLYGRCCLPICMYAMTKCATFCLTVGVHDGHRWIFSGNCDTGIINTDRHVEDFFILNQKIVQKSECDYHTSLSWLKLEACIHLLKIFTTWQKFGDALHDMLVCGNLNLRNCQGFAKRSKIASSYTHTSLSKHFSHYSNWMWCGRE